MSNIKKIELKLLSFYLLCIGWGLTPILSVYLMRMIVGKFNLIHIIISYSICDIMCSMISSIPMYFLSCKDEKTRIKRQIIIIIIYIIIIATAWFAVFDI